MNQVNRVVAIGSPNGDDCAGWCVAELLKDRAEMDVDVIKLTDPSQLLDWLENCSRLIVVDACQGTGAPGKITRLEWPDERIAQQQSFSSHGLGTAEVLQLAEHLGRLPPQVVLFGVEVVQCDPGSPLSDEVKDVIHEIETEVLRELHIEDRSKTA